MSLPDFRPIFFIIGSLLIGFALAMVIPALVEWSLAGTGADAFVTAAAVTGTMGIMLRLTFQRGKTPALRPREGFIFTTLSWLMICGFGSLPMMIGAPHLSFADAFFETMSGLTTTGSSVVSGLDHAPKGFLLWRAMLHFFGGIGIIVMAVAILPTLRVGGMQLFRLESSDKSEKTLPRVSDISKTLITIYLLLNILCTAALSAAGMPFFDAICHAMAAVATGGLSTKDASIGFYQSAAIEWILVIFMTAGSCTFLLLDRFFRGDVRALLNDTQFRWFIGYIILLGSAVALWQIAVNGRETEPAIRSSFFMIVSLGTTTGFVTEDFLQWGSFPIAIAMVTLFLGGCTGSTAGGIKMFRYCILGSLFHWQTRHLVHPHRLLPPTYNRRPISEEVVRSVLAFVLIYLASFVALTLLVSAFDVDFMTASSAVAQALGNVGPGLTPAIGPAGNFSGVADGIKWILSAAMLLGRLELLTVIILLSPTFWRG